VRTAIARRDFLRAGALALVPMAAQQVPQDTAVAPLQQPDLAGRPQDPVNDYANDPFIIGVERRLRCTCGCNLDIYTCRTTDFTCTYSPALHREIVALVQQHKSADEIIATFVAKYGESALMAPPKEGLNWAAYLLPGVAITLVGIVITWVLVRRTRVRVAEQAAAGGPSAFSDEDEARLQAELEQVES
jgi:cytochrome c-type biogenesis protein CcmH